MSQASLQNSWGYQHRVPDCRERHSTNGNQSWSFQAPREGSNVAPCCPLPGGLGALRKPHHALPSPVHSGGRPHQATVSGFFQDAKCHAAGPPASVTPAGKWGLDPRIHVLSPAGGRSAQEDGEWGLDRKGPASPGTCYHRLEALARGPPAQPSFPRSKPRLCLDRVSKGKQNEGQSRQVTRRALSIGVPVIRLGELWSGTASHSGVGDPSRRLVPGHSPGTIWTLTLVHATLGTRRNEGHLVSPCEAENSTPLGGPSPGAYGQRPWPKLPGEAGHPIINSWFSQQPRLLSQGLIHCPHAPIQPREQC